MSSYSSSSAPSRLRRNKNTILFLSMLCLLLQPALPSWAGELVITPGVLARIAWDDNMFLKNFEDGELATEPNLSLTYNTPRTKLGLKGTLSDYRYLDHDEYDRTVYNTSASLEHQLTERFSFGLGGGWVNDYSLDTFWDDNMDERTMLKRDNYNASANASYSLTERDTLDVNVGLAMLDYSKKRPNYADYDMMHASLTWQHFFNDGTMALIAQASWQHIEFDSPLVDYGWVYGTVKQDITQDVYSGMLGLYWAPSQRITIQAMAGANYQESENKTRNANSFFFPDSENSAYDYATGFTGSVDISYRMENGSIRLKVGQEFVPTTYGELRKATTIALSGYYEYTKRANVYATVSYDTSKSDGMSGSRISRDYIYLAAVHSYKLTEDFIIRFRYTYVYYNNKEEDRISRSNNVMLQFVYNLPLHY